MDKLSPKQIAHLRDDNVGRQQLIVLSVFTLLALFTVFLRMYTRMRLVRLVGCEDYFIVLAMCISLCMGAFQCLQVKWGRGTHTIFLDQKQIAMISKYTFLGIIAYNLSLVLTRLSILLLYRRIFTFQRMRIPVDIALGICTTWGTAAVLTRTFGCIPVDASWNLSKKSTARCISQPVFFPINSGLNITASLIVAILPIKALWHLPVPRKEKTALVVILSIGWFVCIASGIRLGAFVRSSRHPHDQTYYDSITACWTVIEVNLAIVCACMPVMKALLVKVVPRFASGSLSRRSTHNQGSSAKRSTNREPFPDIMETATSQV